MRLAFALTLLALFARAPLQCGSNTDTSETRSETPAEGLYGLAEEFKKQGDEKSWKTTLDYIIRRYPNSRFAVRAKNDLERAQSSK